jgi:CheY-like chemotaxis protein
VEQMAKILLVDDEEDIRTSLRRFLEKEKHKVKEAQDGKEAIKILEKEKFDIVILDVLMPGLTGIDVAQQIKKNPKTKDQIIIFCSVVKLGEEGTKKVKEIGPAKYVNKPFSLDEIRRAISGVVKSKKKLQ